MPRETVKKQAVQKKIDRSRTVSLPADYIGFTVDAQPSASFRCGKQLAKAVAHGRDLAPNQIERLAFPCYDVKPASTVTVTISFHGEGERMHRPKGQLRLKTDRGKLSATSIALDGKHEKVTVQFTAPDETIKVSLRAFLDGYGRGKAHLHLQ